MDEAEQLYTPQSNPHPTEMAQTQDSPIAGVVMGPPATPATPKTAAKKRKTLAAAASDDSYEADVATPAKKAKGTPKPRQRKAPTKAPNKSKALATSYDLCEEHDKMLIDMRDSGASWTDIRKAWEEKVGDATAYSTLPNRYSRLKSNFVVIRESDNPKLIEAKQEVEAEFEREKWGQIAERMVSKGAERYKGDALNRQYKKLMVFAQEMFKAKEGVEGEAGGEGEGEGMDEGA
ncbi:uncharacterized protein LTR77_000566 [Saxophila tyrrhenica]|uniref:Myb-like domain-containing protein n=1 Tax=Saxophila tyrrhenica TaxID=1690608 RepID=A0AAV9PNN8_9PEZI|nr:hypothetical protein LTR77_000566 [Saxophila tyrrhenica]